MLDVFVILIEALAEFSCREAVRCKITTKHACCITRHMKPYGIADTCDSLALCGLAVGFV